MDSFVCYIDESGCEGFKFDRGSSEWFILAGVIIERRIEKSVLELVDNIREDLNLAARAPLRWRKLDPLEKEHYCRKIAQERIAITTVCVDKTKIAATESFRVPHRLYFYYARYVIERVSWYVRDRHDCVTEGNRTVSLVFSNKSDMPYDSFRNYMDLLRNEQSLRRGPVQVHWPSIGNIESRTAFKQKGLLIADACAGALGNAFELVRDRPTKRLFVDILRPVIYNRDGNFLSYGLKLPFGISHYETDPMRRWIFEYQ